MAGMSGGFDYSQLKDFYNKLNANFSKQQCNEFVINCSKEIAGRFLRAVKRRTPKGHYDGENYVCEAAKSSMNSGRIHGGNKVKGEDGEKAKKGGTLRAAWNIGTIEYNGVTCDITIVNNAQSEKGVPYAIYVEYGHRTRGGGWTTGHFMMTSTEDDLREKIPLILQKRLEEKLREVFK